MGRPITTTANIFHYEGSLFIVVRSNSTVDVHYMVDVSEPLNHMGSFKSLLTGEALRPKLTEFIDSNIELMMLNEEKESE